MNYMWRVVRRVLLLVIFSISAALFSASVEGATAEWRSFFPVPAAYVRNLLVFQSHGTTKVLAYAEMGPSEHGWPDFTSTAVHVWDELELTWEEASWPYQERKTVEFAPHPGGGGVVYCLSSADGLLRSNDAGATWVLVSDTLIAKDMEDHYKGITSLEIVGTSSVTIYAGTGGGVYRSRDGGATWEHTTSGVASDDFIVWALAVDPQDNDLIFAGGEDQRNIQDHRPHLYRSSNGGDTWVEIIDSRFWHPTDIKVDPSSRTVYLATEGRGIFKSTDHGDSWQSISEGLESPFVTSIALHPALGDVLFAATAPYSGGPGGVFVSANGGLSWRPLNDGLSPRITYDIGISPADPSILYVAALHNPYPNFSPAGAWRIEGVQVELPQHTVSIPSMPSGPSSGQVGDPMSFSTGSSMCSQGHSVQYRFDWGDGNSSSWGSSTTASYAYASAGTYTVRAQARCASDPSVTSGWSSGRSVLIGVDNLAERIDSLLRLGIHIDPYLLTTEGFADSVTTIWLTFTDWITRVDLTEKYDELYWLGFDYANLGYTALIRARRELVVGNRTRAEGWYERYEALARASYQGFKAASEVYLNHIEIAEEIAAAIRKGSEAAVRFGLVFVSPTAAEVGDYVYLLCNYAVDAALHGKEAAMKNAVIDVLVKGLFDYVSFEALGGRTLADWSANRLGKSLFPVLTGVFKNSETMQWALSKVLKEGAITLEKALFESLVDWVTDAAGKCADSVSVTVECPIELCVSTADGNQCGVVDGSLVHTLPMATYVGDEVLLLFPEGEVELHVSALSAGAYSLSIERRAGGASVHFSTGPMPVEQEALHIYYLDWDETVEDIPQLVLSVDDDGDGMPDRWETVNDQEPMAPGQIIVAPNPVRSDGCFFLFNVPADASIVTLRVFSAAGGSSFQTDVDPSTDRFPTTGFWVPRDQHGLPLANGAYLVVLVADDVVVGRGKMVVQR